MQCIVTAGPTFEPLDEVRRLTNLSTGRLGTQLANHLGDRGHRVTLLLGAQATWPGPRRAWRIEVFTTTGDLLRRLQAQAKAPVDAVFHAAAVSDFAFGRIWRRTASGNLRRVGGGKISTRRGALLAELMPTPKIISHLRAWFPLACLVGWKYEVGSGREQAIARARRQLRESLMDACVANGPGYGRGYGVVPKEGRIAHLAGERSLFIFLERMLSAHQRKLP
jgi:phosphopantothenate---cysteine ligase (CTP)